MPRLILLNGPPASGKSTLARMYAEQHPPAVSLEVDHIRAMIGRWRQYPAAGLLARQMALAAARVHLAAGHDVVVPQLVARPEFPARLESLAAGTGADFREVFLLPDEQTALSQYAERARSAGGAAQPGLVLSTDLGDAELADWYRLLLTFLATRPEAVVVRTQPGQIAAAYDAFAGCLGEARN